MTLKVAKSGKSGKMELACPGGASLGKSKKFKIRHGDFVAKQGRQWSFKGHFDSKAHFKGNGSTADGACGASPTKFREPVPHRAKWISCPPDDVLNPYPANTPFTFVGVLKGAALGTRLRVEYTNPDSQSGHPKVAHLKTDAAGNFSDTHSFPDEGSEYGAAATARYPDKALATGRACGFDIQ
jgi:hypothetical protein